PDKSTAKARLNGGSAALQRAWYQGQVAKFFSFDEAPLSGSDVPLSPIYVTFNVNPDQPNGGPGSGFKAEPNSEQTHNVPATLPGDTGYSPLWLVAVYHKANWPEVKDLKTALKSQGPRPSSGDRQLSYRVNPGLASDVARPEVRKDDGLDLTINCSQLSPRSEISLSRLDKEMNGAGIRKGLASQTLP